MPLLGGEGIKDGAPSSSMNIGVRDWDEIMRLSGEFRAYTCDGTKDQLLELHLLLHQA